MAAIEIGDRVPEFAAPSQTGEVVRSTDLFGKQAVVLYFYPRDETTVCTAEACGFRDAYEDFAAAGATVVGVSSDSVDRHRQFTEKRRLPFVLLSDEDGTLRKAFGVPKTFGIFPGRVTYVIDREGIVRHVFNAMFNAGRHVQEALDVVQSLPRG